MAAVAILELLRKNPNFGGQAFNSRGLFSQKLAGAATASAASLAVTVPFAFDDGATQCAYCDAGGTDYTSNYQTISRNLYRKDALTYSYSTKRYYIQLKSIFSVFYWENLPLISLSGTNNLRAEQIIYETTVVTTTRVLERIVVQYVSRRAAWKLLKDVPMSAIRKSRRRQPLSTYIYNVGKTTFRGHFLGVLVSWIVNVGVDIYEFFTYVYKRRHRVGTAQQFRVLAKWVFGATIRCGAALVFASIGGGVGATIVNPAAGQFIGCIVGDFAGPVVVKFCFKKLRLNL
ncbi:hypothetical protein ABFS83_14G165400 [Erythranthe nasuta]